MLTCHIVHILYFVFTYCSHNKQTTTNYISLCLQDTSRSIELATAPNEALQEVFTIIGSVRQNWTFLSVIFCFFSGFFHHSHLAKPSFPFCDFFVFHWNSGSFYHSHLAGLHLLSELGSWDDRSWSSTREISGWSLIKALILTLLLFLIDTDLLFSTIPYLLRQLTDHAARQGRSEVYHGSTFDSLIKLWSWLSRLSFTDLFFSTILYLQICQSLYITFKTPVTDDWKALTPAQYFPKQNLWWLSPEFASSEDQIYKRNAFTGGTTSCHLELFCHHQQYWTHHAE